MMQTQLPTTLASVYRLFLRTCSAAVLHHRQSCLNLRKRWRPTFDAAARVAKELQQAPPDATDAWREEKEQFLRTWNERIDSTLDILYNSAISRGLPHQLTKNLGNIHGIEYARSVSALAKLPKWQPQDTSIPQVPKPLSAKQLRKNEEKREQTRFSDNALGALDEVIRMAEGTAGLTLGRHKVVIRRWTLKSRR